ncbi:hypothetical protein ACTFIZ_011623 [Dictyostelium cf. discoideum]
MRVLLLLVFLVFCVIPAALSFRDTNWSKYNRAGKKETVDFRIALNQRNLDVLENTLLDVSNPESVNYGKHWTSEQVADLVAPEPYVSKKVANYLKKNGCHNIENHRDYIKATGSVDSVEKIFSVEMYNYKHNIKSDQAIIRSSETYQVPFEISQYVHIVSGISELPHLKSGPKSQRLRPNPKDFQATPAPAGPADPGMVVPQTIQQLYGIPSNYQNNQNTSLCLAEFAADRSYQPKDLKTFAAKTGTPLINVVKNVGPFQPTQPDLESTLDVQYGGATAQTADVWFWTVNGWMYEFSSDLAATVPAPYVVSMSWGWPEPLQCQQGIGNCTDGESSQEYVNRVNIEFQKIGLRGITLLASSGDQGAPGDGNPSCTSRDQPISTIFPGASPWVTSVGATMLAAPSASNPNPIDTSDAPVCGIHACATSTQEVTCSSPSALITTGGGFSNYSPQPAWQSKAVNAYLNSGVVLPNKKFFNASNRGFPDVSGLGHNYYIVAADQMNLVDGTSCSSPVIGGIVALLNSYRLDNGKSTLGFINPVLYAAYASNPAIFNDITVGNNYCTESCCATTGFLATKGWDAVTGLGSPNFKPLLSYIQSLN